MTNTHMAGSIHADLARHLPSWLGIPTDVNALLPKLWSANTAKDQAGELRVAGLPVSEIARQVGTPAYVLDEADLRQRAREFVRAFAGWQVSYAGKAFLCKAVARWVVDEGCRLDVCTGGELEVALAAGIAPDQLTFHGNNKSEGELAAALRIGLGVIVVDSFTEISRLSALAQRHAVRPKILVRVTSGVEAHTHAYIATAHEDQKFGISLATGEALTALRQCQNDPQLELAGIHCHIGSQIFDADGFEVSARRCLRLLASFRDEFDFALPEFNLGGGFGIAYTSVDDPATPAELATAMNAIVQSECASLKLPVPRLAIEPGRAISGPSMLMLYEVGTVKPVALDGGGSRLYVSVDGGMSDNIRTALYAAEYSATLANRRSLAAPVLSRVVGKHCESGDIVVRDEFLPADIAPGDLLAIPASGGYSRSMASNYNHVPRPPVVAVTEGRITTLIRREQIADLLALDVS